MINELADRSTPDDAVVVLDDYHLIQSEQVHGSVLMRAWLASVVGPVLPRSETTCRNSD